MAEKPSSEGIVAERIELAMRRKHLSQSQLAKLVGVEQASVSFWISGTYEPRKKSFKRLSEVLSRPVEWLMGLGLTDEELKAEKLMLQALLGADDDADNDIIEAVYDGGLDRLKAVLREAYQADGAGE